MDQGERGVGGVEAVGLPAKFQSRVTSAIRDLEGLGVAPRLDDMSLVLARAPDLTYVVLRYVASVATHDAVAATNAFVKSLSAEHYLREYETLAVCKAALAMPPARSLAERFDALAASDPSHLVRARALLAWGVHSAHDDLSGADAFWSTTSNTWQAYPLVAIQRKEAKERDARYERWSGEGRYLNRLAHELQASPIRWTKT